MGPRVKDALKTAVSLWMIQTIAVIKRHPDHFAELKACFEAGREIRIAYRVRSNDVAVEVVNKDGTVSEIYRDIAGPDDGGFALPAEAVKQ